jgi:hypothetical protein
VLVIFEGKVTWLGMPNPSPVWDAIVTRVDNISLPFALCNRNSTMPNLFH